MDTDAMPLSFRPPDDVAESSFLVTLQPTTTTALSNEIDLRNYTENWTI